MWTRLTSDLQQPPAVAWEWQHTPVLLSLSMASALRFATVCGQCLSRVPRSKGQLSAEGSWGSRLTWAEEVRGSFADVFGGNCGKSCRKRAGRWGRERGPPGDGWAFTWCSTEENGDSRERPDKLLCLGVCPMAHSRALTNWRWAPTRVRSKECVPFWPRSL